MKFRKIDLQYVDWICLAEFTVRWWALVKAVMKLRIAQKAEEFLG
jgi:hypothetical protein